MSEEPPALVWKWNTRSCCSAAAKHASAISRVSASQVCGSGLPPSRKVVLSATIPVLAGLLQGLQRHLPVLRAGTRPTARREPVVPRDGLQDQVVERERWFLHRYPVVGQDQRPFETAPVEVPSR